MLGSRRTAAVVAAALLALPACSGDQGATEETATDETSTSASPSADASEAATEEEGSLQEQLAPEEPERPAARNTPEARRAFARYVMAAWAYALSTNDAAAVTSISPRDEQCAGCKDLTKELASRKKDGWFVDFPGVEVDSITLRPINSISVAPLATATAKVDIPASRSYFEDGSFRNDNDAHENTDFAVTMRLDGKRFVLLAFQVG